MRERSDTVPGEPQALRRLAQRGLEGLTPGPDHIPTEGRAGQGTLGDIGQTGRSDHGPLRLNLPWTPAALINDRERAPHRRWSEPGRMRAGDPNGTRRPALGTGMRENEGQRDLTSWITCDGGAGDAPGSWPAVSCRRDWPALLQGRRPRLFASRSTAAMRERGTWTGSMHGPIVAPLPRWCPCRARMRPRSGRAQTTRREWKSRVRSPNEQAGYVCRRLKKRVDMPARFGTAPPTLGGGKHSPARSGRRPCCARDHYPQGRDAAWRLGERSE